MTARKVTPAFRIGQLDLFVTQNISDRFKFLTELVFKVHKNNEFEEGLERCSSNTTVTVISV